VSGGRAGMSDFDIEITNEFSTVLVRKVQTRNGVRLELYSPKLDRRIWLDALALESLTWQNMDLFSVLLEQPFGPADDESD
jgi:hypothetical protein